MADERQARLQRILNDVTRREGEKLRAQVGGWSRRWLCWFGWHIGWVFAPNVHPECLRCRQVLPGTMGGPTR